LKEEKLKDCNFIGDVIPMSHIMHVGLLEKIDVKLKRNIKKILREINK